MSYLEQLKKETHARQTTELEIQQQQEQQAEIFRVQVKPALERLHLYLHELTQQLNHIKPDTQVSYEIKGYGKVDDFQQQNYRIMTYDEFNALHYQVSPTLEKRNDFLDTSSNFFLRCMCQTPYKLRLKTQKKHEMALQRNYFSKHNIRFTCTEENDVNYKFIRAVFVVEPAICVEFGFVGNFETSTIDFTVTNFDKLSKKTYSLQPKEINKQWLNELSKYITRQPHNLVLCEKKPFIKKQSKTSLKVKPLPKKQHKQVVIEKTEKKPVMANDLEEFDEWLRIQEEQLATKANQQSISKKNRLFRFFKKK
ncbi:hypothetical protein [Candidatus Parabeggiatoa sp. HSG14]|uniref:hypothetical protein n=1 Tax=Candidatus Parabeggiatoa sp. HSG14 TaxID=3055593 RepID=UPI0025A820DD|nr:hypothetical protein [Thiotrichales bacterium HSG14]